MITTFPQRQLGYYFDHTGLSMNTQLMVTEMKISIDASFCSFPMLSNFETKITIPFES